MGNKVWAFALVVIFSSAMARAAKPDDEGKQRARQEYSEATKDYNLGDYQSALTRFKAAYRAFPDPSFLFNIAQCHRMLDQKIEAVRAYRAFLRDARSGRAEAEQVIASLEKAIAEEQAAKAKTPIGTMADPTQPPQPPLPPRPAAHSPEPLSEPPPIAMAAPTAPVAVAPLPSTTKPIYKRGWFWGVVVGSVLVVGVGVGVGVGVALGTTKTSFPSSGATDGTFRF